MLLSLFSSLFCQTPFARLLLQQGEKDFMVLLDFLLGIPYKRRIIAAFQIAKCGKGVPEMGTKPLKALRGYRGANRGSQGL